MYRALGSLQAATNSGVQGLPAAAPLLEQSAAICTTQGRTSKGGVRAQGSCHVRTSHSTCGREKAVPHQ